MVSSVGVWETVVVGVVVLVAPVEVVLASFVKLLFKLSKPDCKLSLAERNRNAKATIAIAARSARYKPMPRSPTSGILKKVMRVIIAANPPAINASIQCDWVRFFD